MSQVVPVNILTSYFPKIHSNIILPSTRMVSVSCLFLDLLTKILYAFLVSPTRAACTTHHILPYLFTILIFSEA